MKDRAVTREDWGMLPSLELPVVLKRKLAEATVVRAELVPPDVVTLKTRFSYLDERSGDWKVVMLVAERSGSAGGREELSVLSPLGEGLYQTERVCYGVLPLAP